MNSGLSEFLKATPQDRRDVFLSAAARLGTPEQNVEKDFWVTWTLDVLFNGLPDSHPRFLFKGGTSLSKAYGLISRFSEDIDITVFREEGIKLVLGDDALEEVARFAAQVNEASENIGARRLHTIMEKLLEDVSFEGPDLKKKTVKVDAAYVRKQLSDIVKDQDLSRYIL